MILEWNDNFSLIRLENSFAIYWNIFDIFDI